MSLVVIKQRNTFFSPLFSTQSSIKLIKALMFSAIYVTFSLKAAVINVTPGNNTLSTAVAAAAVGDTLVLTGGVYTEDSQLNIDKGISIKGSNINDKPTLSGINIAIRENNDLTFTQDIIIQALQMAGGSLRSVNCSGTTGSYGTFNFLQNELNDTQLDYRRDCTNNIVMVGNSIIHSGAQEYLVASLNDVIFASNTVEVSRANTVFNSDLGALNIGESESNTQSCHVIGNDIAADGANKSRVVKVECDSGTVFGNKMSAIKRSNQGNTAVLELDGNGIYEISNNVISVDPVAGSAYATSTDTLGRESLAIRFNNFVPEGTAIVSNNVINWANEITKSSPTTNVSLIEYSNDIHLYNNIFYGVSDMPLIPISTTGINNLELKKYNICFGGNSACIEGTSNTEADPSFVDMIDYQLNTGSPAINAGNPGDRYNDVDGSLNDIGVQGGSLPYSQYKDQLTTSSKPFLYPLFRANNSVGANNEMAVKILAVARAQ